MGNLTGLRMLRARAGLSQRQLAVKAGLNVTTIVNFEAGRSKAPQAATVGRLARALGVPIEELLELLEEAAS